MQNKFDEIIDRRGTSCLKWDKLFQIYGSDDLVSMWVADSDFKCPKPIIDALIKRSQHGIFGYTVRPEEFYQAIIDWCKKRNGWEIKKEWIVYTPGIVPALNWAVQVYTKPGDKVIIQPPVYYPFFTAVKNNGRELVENTLIEENGAYRMDFDGLEKAIDNKCKLFILCSPQNPVGRVWTKEELEKLSRICNKHGIKIISDEIHSDLIMPGYKHYCIGNLDEETKGNTMTCMAPSKTFNVAGLETAVTIIPNEEMRKQFIKFQGEISVGMSNIFGIEAFVAAYTKCEDWLQEEIKYIDDNAKYFEKFVCEHIPQYKVTKLEATYLLWLDCKCLNMTKEELKEFFIKDVQVALDSGDIFGETGEGFMRFNLATPRAYVEKVLKNLEQATKALENKNK